MADSHGRGHSSAQHAGVLGSVRKERRALPWAQIDDDVFARAFEVQGALAERGHHRLPIPDLIIAAAAEHAELAVLHYDADFDKICAVTGQPHEWVVPRGSV